MGNSKKYRVFPKKFLQFELGSIKLKETNTFNIIVPFKPFKMDNELVETEVYLDGVMFDTIDISNLEGRIYSFPTSPEKGYIDASVYLGGTHNPIDVRKIIFQKKTKKCIKCIIYCSFDMEFENSGFSNFQEVIYACLKYDSRS
jgi:hypothetical protein